MKFLKNLNIKNFKYGLITTLVVSISVLIDLVSKVVTDGINIEIISKLLWFSSTHNYGAAYGIFSHQTTMLIIITFVMLIVMLIYNWFHKKKSVFYCLSLGLIIGGAIGNLFDRLFLGYVRDFIKFSFFSFNCNVADICLTFGVILFIIYLLFIDDFFKISKLEKNKKTTDNTENINKNDEKTYKNTENIENIEQKVENNNLNNNLKNEGNNE